MALKKEIPIGIKLVAILFGIRAIFLLFRIKSPKVDVLFKPESYAIVVIILILLAGLMFFIGLYLWLGRKWAKSTAILLSGLGLILALISISISKEGIINNIIEIIINLGIGIYLLVDKKVKEFFS